MADWQKTFVKQFPSVSARVTHRVGSEYYIELFAGAQLFLAYGKTFENEEAALAEADAKLASYQK